MSAEPIIFDPEIEELLHRIAADPDSSLLRVTRPQAVMGLFERTQRVSVGTTGLSSAERELVRVHRHEVAHLLREVCRWRMLNSREIGDKACPFNTQGTQHPTAPPTTSAIVAEGEVHDLDALEGLQLVHRCIAEDREVPATSSIALAAYRLEPSSSARMYIGLDLTLRFQPRSALHAFRALLEDTTDPALRSLALSNAGMAYELLERPKQEIECYRSAALSGTHPMPPFEWLFTSLRQHNKDQALEAGRVAEDVIARSPSAFQWYLDALERRRARGAWTPTPSLRAFAQEVGSSLPNDCRRIVDAFV